MHNEMKIISLEQRWQCQLLKLMYRLSSNDVYMKKSGVKTRRNVKRKFKLMTKCSSKYLNSPIYKGSILWDNLTVEIQSAPTMLLFTRMTKKMYANYRDLLEMY